MGFDFQIRPAAVAGVEAPYASGVVVQSRLNMLPLHWMLLRFDGENTIKGVQLDSPTDWQ
jgi:hypothetical protein